MLSYIFHLVSAVRNIIGYYWPWYILYCLCCRRLFINSMLGFEYVNFFFFFLAVVLFHLKFNTLLSRPQIMRIHEFYLQIVNFAIDLGSEPTIHSSELYSTFLSSLFSLFLYTNSTTKWEKNKNKKSVLFETLMLNHVSHRQIKTYRTYSIAYCYIVRT